MSRWANSWWCYCRDRDNERRKDTEPRCEECGREQPGRIVHGPYPYTVPDEESDDG